MGTIRTKRQDLGAFRCHNSVGAIQSGQLGRKYLSGNASAGLQCEESTTFFFTKESAARGPFPGAVTAVAVLVVLMRGSSMTTPVGLGRCREGRGCVCKAHFCTYPSSPPETETYFFLSLGRLPPTQWLPRPFLRPISDCSFFKAQGHPQRFSGKKVAGWCRGVIQLDGSWTQLVPRKQQKKHNWVYFSVKI